MTLHFGAPRGLTLLKGGEGLERGTRGVVPRKPREEVAGGIHHVYARGNNKALLFVDDVDREGYLWLLGTEVGRRRWRCLSYCLMDNHMHLLIETPEPNLGRGMQRLHGDFGRGFNRRHSRSGHVFQGRYGSKPVSDDEQLWTVAATSPRIPSRPACAARQGTGPGAATRLWWVGWQRPRGSTWSACTSGSRAGAAIRASDTSPPSRAAGRARSRRTTPLPGTGRARCAGRLRGTARSRAATRWRPRWRRGGRPGCRRGCRLRR